jgi:hypothetical protein
MPRRLRLFYSALTVVVLLIPAIAIYGELSKRPDIWWTPRPLAISLAESRDRVEIYVRGMSLGDLVDARHLWISDQGKSSPVGADEISLRFNNWDRIRAARLPLLLLYAGAGGAGLAILVLIAGGRLTYRPEKDAVAA